MSRYEDFEDWRRANRPHRATSDAAGDSMADAIPVIRRRVLRHVEGTGGVTCDAAEQAPGYVASDLLTAVSAESWAALYQYPIEKAKKEARQLLSPFDTIAMDNARHRILAAGYASILDRCCPGVMPCWS